MSAAPHLLPTPEPSRKANEQESSPALRLAAGGTLLAGAVLLLAGKRRSGLVTTAAGTALALLQEKETTLRWWATLPLILSNTQRVIGQTQGVIHELNARRERLQGFFKK